MVTRDDVVHEKRLPGPIEITVTEVNNRPRHPREVEVSAVDVNEDELHVIVWKIHDLEHDWTEGESYELRGGRGKIYSTGSGKRVEIHSTRSFEVKVRGNASRTTRLLVVGDTHVGYRHRPTAKKPTWARNVDNRETFTRVFDRARELDVDAIIHAGDVFDHNTTESDLDTVYDEIAKTIEQGISFCFVRGNHDEPPGRRLLKRLVNDKPICSRLKRDPISVGTPAVMIYGIDYQGDYLPRITPERALRVLPHQTILVVHDTPYPVVDDSGKLIHERNGPNLVEFLSESSVEPDLVISGHMHVGNEGIVRGHDVPVLSTGPTAPISDYTADNEPSTWLVSVSNDEFEIKRQRL